MRSQNAPLQEPRRAAGRGGPRGPDIGRPGALLRPGVGPVRGQLGLGRPGGWGRSRSSSGRLRDEYGLALALHLMIHTKSLGEDPAIYRRRPRRRDRRCGPTAAYAGGFVCAGLAGLAAAEGRAAAACWPEPGCRSSCSTSSATRPRATRDAGGRTLPVQLVERTGARARLPLTLEEHCRGHHDRRPGGQERSSPGLTHRGPRPHRRRDSCRCTTSTARPTPTTNSGASSTCGTPIPTCSRGRALSLYEYNLAYDIPLYLHINSASRQPGHARLLVVRLLPAATSASAAWPKATSSGPSLTEAMQHGTDGSADPGSPAADFVGIDPVTHLHVLDGRTVTATAVARC